MGEVIEEADVVKETLRKFHHALPSIPLSAKSLYELLRFYRGLSDWEKDIIEADLRSGCNRCPGCLQYESGEKGNVRCGEN